MPLPAPQASVYPSAHKELRLFRADAAAQHCMRPGAFPPSLCANLRGGGCRGATVILKSLPAQIPFLSLVCFPVPLPPLHSPEDSRSGQRPCDKSPWALPRHTGLCLFALSRTAPLATAARQPSRAAEAEFLRRERGGKCVTGREPALLPSCPSHQEPLSLGKLEGRVKVGADAWFESALEGLCLHVEMGETRIGKELLPGKLGVTALLGDEESTACWGVLTWPGGSREKGR